MQSAPPRNDEAASLAALRALDVLDSGPEAEFDALVRAASIVCGVSVSLLSLVDAERQWFKANIGLPGVSETPRDLAFCAHAVLGDELFEVADASLDARFADNPLVADQPGIRFYAGAPLRLSDGSRIGTLCVIDRQPQRLNEDQRQVLMALATAAVQALEGRRAMRAVKQISRDVADSEARFRALSESVPIGVFELDALGHFSYANQRLLDIVGLRRGQVLRWTRVVHADDRKELSLRWSTALARQQDLDAQFRVLRPDGRIRHLRANARLRLGDGGLPSGYVGTVEDITELRHQQDALRTSRAFLDRTGRLGGVGGWELDLADKSLYWSDETCRIHGLPAGQSPSLEEALAFYTDEARPLIQQAVDRAVSSGAGFDLELPQLLRDGRRVWVRAVGSIEFEDGRAARLVGAFQDVSERVNERLALEEAHSLVQLAADSGGIGIWDYDLVNDRLKWDAWMYRLYGQAPGMPGEQQGDQQFWARHVHPDDLLETEQAMQDAIAGKRDFAAEFRIIWADGSEHSIRSSALIKRDPAGRALRMVGVNWDTTEQHRIEAELREAKRVAEAANKAKSEFLANMSHEIRTPMNAILGLLTLLRRTPLSERQADYAGKTEGAARALLGLLNEILDFSKVEAGKMTLDPQPMRLDALLRDLSVILAANIGARNLRLLFDIDPALPSEWVADAMRLQQVLVNLAGNAIKFTEQGEVSLSMALLQQDEEAVRVRFAVRDTGIGIAPENQARIFAGFSQAEASTTRRFGGTGLGLAISQRLVALMGGELSLQSELGRGSCFEFSLSLKRSGAAFVYEQQAPLALLGQQRLAGLRLLLVEDNLNNQQVACELLSEEGAVVQIAADGQQAINALAGAGAGAFDIVLMDLQMPVMDGYAATRHVREVLGLRDLPIVAMTANAMSSDRAACLAAGMNDHVGKPFDLDDLVRVLCQHAGRSAPAAAAHAAYRQAEPALTQAAAAAGVDLDAALQRMGGKPAVYRHMLGHFVQELPALREQLALVDVAACRRLLHTLKGVAATLGAERLAAQAGRQERALADGGALSDCVAAADAALSAALPGLTELARLLRMSAAAAVAATAAGEGPRMAQLPADERLALGAALTELMGLLQDSDMAALAQMSALQARYAAALGGSGVQLDEALSRLDFTAAMTQCRALLEQLLAESA